MSQTKIILTKSHREGWIDGTWVSLCKCDIAWWWIDTMIGMANFVNDEKELYGN